MKKSENKIAVVTGGNSGIGFATAKELIAQGATVLITGRKQDLVDKAAKEIGATGIVADQSNLKDIDTLVTKTKSQFGKVDILFINAGVFAMAPIGSIAEEQFDSIMDINFKGAFFTLQQFLPLLSEGSSVIFLSSISAYAAAPNIAIYNASKAALNSLTRTAAYELASKGIRVNAVCPGPVNTPIFGKIGLPEEAVQQFATEIQQRVPLKRFGTAEDIAKLVAFISSDDASFITGSEYVIDGGINLKAI